MKSIDDSRFTGKRLAFSLILAFFTSAAMPPLTLLNTTLTQPSRAVAYTGVDNIMTIRGDLNGGSLRIERSGGPVSMRPGTSIIFKLRYSSPGSDTIRVFSDDLLLLEKIYEILPEGNYSVGLFGKDDTLLSAEDIRKAGKLSVKMPGTLFRPAEKVLGFSLDICSPERKILRKFTIKGSTMSPEIMEEIASSEPATVLVFHTISTNLAAGKNLHSNEFSIILK